MFFHESERERIQREEAPAIPSKDATNSDCADTPGIELGYQLVSSILPILNARSDFDSKRYFSEGSVHADQYFP